MASLVFKKSRGHSYAYWVRSARVNGKPRIVEQVYLGPKDRFLEELKLYFTRGRAKVLMGLCRGKQKHDKREAMKKAQAKRDMAQAMRRR